MMTAGPDLNICGKEESQPKQNSNETITEVTKHCHGESILKINKLIHKTLSSNVSDWEQNVEGVARQTRAGRTLRNRKYRRAFEENRQTKRLFTPEIKKFLKGWLVRRRKNPYPNRNEKKELAVKTGLTYIQICNWFANWRRKLKNSCNEQHKATWGHLIKDYNTQVQGNVEQFSISSDDSIWDESAYNKDSDNLCTSVYHSTEITHNHSFTTEESECKSKPVIHFQSDNQSLSNLPKPDQTETKFHKICEPINSTKSNIVVNEPNKIDAPVLLSKWLESAEKFRPRESYVWSATNMTWQNSVSRQLPKKIPPSQNRLLLGRHREELDAAEALTYLSHSSTSKLKPVAAIGGH